MSMDDSIPAPMYSSPVVASERSSLAKKGFLIPGQPFLIDCNGPVLNTRPLSDEASPEPNRSVRLPAVISAIALYKVPAKGGKAQGIVALANDALHFIEMSVSGLVIRQKLPLAIVQGHARPPERGPWVDVVSAGTTEVLVLYAVSGFLTLVDLEGLFSAKRPKRVHCTFSIGNIVVVSLAVLPASSMQATVAILYRDIDFNYSLRYYGVDSHIDKLPVVRQMELFSGTPSFVAAVPNGCLVFSDLKMWFFPLSGMNASLEGASARDATISSNSKHNVVTKSLAAHVVGSKITCTTKIDTNRLLYITDTGSTHMVYIHTVGNRSHAKITDLQVLDLGKSTIANSLVHVNDNVFYAGSHISRSIVFQIRPTSPFIHVAKTITNSPPILDVAVGNDAYSRELWISRGGFHNGEVQLFTGTKLGMVLQAEVGLQSSPTSVRFSSPNSLVLYQEGQEAGRFSVGSQLVPDQSAHLSHPFNGLQDVKSWNVGSQELTLDGGTFSYGGVQRSVPETEITDMVYYVQEHTLHIIVALWGGRLSHLNFGTHPGVDTVETGGEGHTSVCRTRQDMVFSIDGTGNIFCSQGFGGKSQQISANATEGSFKLATDEDTVLVYSANSIYMLEGADILQPKRVYWTRRRIVSCDVNQAKVAVLFHDNTLATFNLQDAGPNANAYLSDKLILKAVPMGKWVVSLQMEIVSDPYTRAPQRSMSLLLLDAQTLQVVAQESVGAGLVDICLVCTNGHSFLVGAYTGCKPEDILRVFRVSNGRIQNLHVPISGRLPKTATIAKVTAHSNHVCVAGSTALQFTLDQDLDDPDSFFWTGCVLHSNATPFFFVDVAWSAQGLVLVDANRGIFFRRKDGPVEKLLLEYSPSYPTSVAILEHAPVVIYGDSCGNLGISQNGHTLLAANIHEQINTITVVAEKPLRLLVGTVTGSVYEVNSDGPGTLLEQDWVTSIQNKA